MLRTRLVAGVTSGVVLSAVFATVLTVAAYGEVFVEPWRVDPSQPAPVTLRIPRTRVQTLDADGQMNFSVVREMVPRGQMVPQEPQATLIRAYERARRPASLREMGAQWFIYLLLFLTATTYMRRGSTKAAGLLRMQVGLLSLALVTLLGSKAALLFTDLPATAIPASLVPLWAALYVDRRTGLMLGAAVSVCAASLVSYDVVAGAVLMAASLTSTMLFRNRKQVGMMIVAGLAGGIAASLVYVAAKELSGGFSLMDEIALGFRSEGFMALVAPVVAAVLGLLSHPLTSRMLGIVSRARLLNLSDLDEPLLQKMQNEAPGSWEHSRMMANLAEAAASAIGSDTLLTRVGAYYHDLGKSVQPKYFVENLVEDEKSPHDELEPHVSADAIMAHVVEGVRILRDGGIPEPVIEFSYTHHGTSVIEYFWHKHQELEGAKEMSEDAFRYPGMRPRTRETGILMLIDAIEAGARTVEPPTRKGFEELVRRVIFTKLKQGQLDESGLSLEDLRVCANRITDSLCSAYHSRIKYPWQEKKAAEAAEAVATAITQPMDELRPERTEDRPSEDTPAVRESGSREAPAVQETTDERPLVPARSAPAGEVTPVVVTPKEPPPG